MAKLALLLSRFYTAKSAEGCSMNTIEDYRKGFRHFTAWFQLQGESDVAALTPQTVRTFLAELRDLPNPKARAGKLSPKTIYNAWVALKSFFRWLQEEEGVANPMVRVTAPKVQNSIIEPLSLPQVEAILKACDTTQQADTQLRNTFVMRRDLALRDRCIVMVLLDAGLRSGELCNLTVGDLERDSGKLSVRYGKGGKSRVSYVSKTTRRALLRYLDKRGRPDAHEPLFVTRFDRPLSPDQLTNLFRHLGERAGVDHLHPHRFRHTFATEYLLNGGNLLTLQRLLGHNSLNMVRRYAQIAEIDLQRAHEGASPVDRWRLPSR